MPSSRSVASQVYAPGNYGPFTIDNLIKNDSNYLEIEFTVEDWPIAAPLITGRLRWDNGSGSDFSINSPPMSRLGVPLTKVIQLVGVQKNAEGNLPVASATAAMTVFVTMRTAITLRAVGART